MLTGGLNLARELVASVKQTVTVWVAEAQSTGRRATLWDGLLDDHVGAYRTACCPYEYCGFIMKVKCKSRTKEHEV